MLELCASINWILPFVRLLQVSYGASSFYLSDKEKYPLFFRTVPPEEGHNHGRVAVLKYFKWDRVAIVTERESYYEAVSKNRYSLARFLKGHSQLAHMHIRYHFIAHFHITDTQ